MREFLLKYLIARSYLHAHGKDLDYYGKEGLVNGFDIGNGGI